MKNNTSYPQTVPWFQLLKKADGELYKIPVASPCLMFVVVHSGKLQLEVDGTAYLLKSAELFVVQLRSSYRLEKRDEPVKCFCLVIPSRLGSLEFKGLFFLPLFRQTVASGIPFSLERSDQRLLTQILKLLKIENKVRDGFVLLLLELFLLSVRRLYQKNGLAANMHNDRRQQLVYEFLELVGKWCSSEHSVRFYAQHLCVTPAHLNKTVKSIMGQSAKTCLMHYILSQAKLLLEDPAQSIAAISDHLHFSHPAVFSRFFTKLTGITPSNYRKNQ